MDMIYSRQAILSKGNFEVVRYSQPTHFAPFDSHLHTQHTQHTHKTR